jgi:hypothetical protein
MRCRLVIVLFFLFESFSAFPARAGEDVSERQAAASAEPVIYLDVQASTWRPRGRISFGIVPALRTKLASAGFVVTQNPEQRHDMTLKVEYRETRGKTVSINLSGTDITCLILLEHPQIEQPLSLNIHESPSYTDLVNAPYVEVVEKLEANPYFYFLGDIVRGWTNAHVDTTGALIQALDRQFDRELHPPPVAPQATLVSPGETFPDLDVHFAPSAQQNTIDELSRLKDSRAIDLLERLTVHTDRRTRLHAVLALGQFDAPSIAPVMAHVAEADSDSAVRDAAAGVLTKLSPR